MEIQERPDKNLILMKIQRRLLKLNKLLFKTKL